MMVCTTMGMAVHKAVLMTITMAIAMTMTVIVFVKYVSNYVRTISLYL